MRKRGLCCRPVSIRLSVRPSVTLVYYIHTAEDIVKLFIRPGSHIILDFRPQRRYPTPMESLHWAQNTRGGKNLQFSTEVAVYLGNGTLRIVGSATGPDDSSPHSW